MKALALTIVAAAVLACLPLVASEYGLSFSIQLLIFAAMAYSWNLIGGFAGYPHFGQMAFFGVGAYVGALLMGAGWHWIPAAAISGLGGIVMAAILGGAMLRLKGPFFAIGMFGIARVCESLALGLDGITQGGTGLYLLPVDLTQLYWVLAALVLAMILITWRLDNSRLGLQLLTIREDEVAAEALGVKTTRLKIGTFIASAIVPAATGSLYASYLGFIDPPTAFAPMTELTTIAMVLLGGMGTVFGPLVGVAVLSVVNEFLWTRFPEIYLAVVGVVMLVAILFMPRGIMNFVQRKDWFWVPVARGRLRKLALRRPEFAK